LYKKYNRLNIKKHFFSQRVIDAWNQLPPSVVDVASINSFNKNLDDFWKEMGMALIASLPITIQDSRFKIVFDSSASKFKRHQVSAVTYSD